MKEHKKNIHKNISLSNIKYTHTHAHTPQNTEQMRTN